MSIIKLAVSHWYGNIGYEVFISTYGPMDLRYARLRDTHFGTTQQVLGADVMHYYLNVEMHYYLNVEVLW